MWLLIGLVACSSNTRHHKSAFGGRTGRLKARISGDQRQCHAYEKATAQISTIENGQPWLHKCSFNVWDLCVLCAKTKMKKSICKRKWKMGNVCSSQTHAYIHLHKKWNIKHWSIWNEMKKSWTALHECNVWLFECKVHALAGRFARIKVAEKAATFKNVTPFQKGWPP